MEFYTLLGIPRNADDDAVRKAYRGLVRRYHPDSGVGSSEEKFRQITEAYETLIDRSRRHAYDASLGRAEPGMPVRIEPIMTRPVFREEDPSIFGRVEGARRNPPLGASRSLDDFFDRWFDLLDEFFFGPEWP